MRVKNKGRVGVCVTVTDLFRLMTRMVESDGLFPFTTKIAFHCVVTGSSYTASQLFIPDKKASFGVRAFCLILY